MQQIFIHRPSGRRATGLATLLLSTFVALFIGQHLVPNDKPGISQYAQAMQQLLQPKSQSAPNPNLLQPLFIKSMDSHNVRENTPLEEVVYTLEAQTDPQYQASLRITYDIEGTQLFAVDRNSGQVRVAQPIDREQTGDSISFQVIATAHFMGRPGTPAKLTITVYIIDENDNAPKIERVKLSGRGQEYDANVLTRLAYGSNQPLVGLLQVRAPVIRLNISEDTPADTILVDLIEAIDVDKASSSPLSATCLDCEPEFRLASRSANLLNDRLEWSLVLARQLVHLPRKNLRPLHVIVSDGKFNTSLIFEVTIDDVQNRAPHFVSSTTCVVQENTPIDRTILTLQAVDGDAVALDDGSSLASTTANNKFNGRQIIYDFVETTEGQAGVVSSSYQADFKLHPLTGQLQVANRLDREAYLSQSGVLTLQVRARELTVDAETVVAGDDLYESILSKLTNFIDPSEQAASVSDVTIILVDVNDNSPRWLNASEIAAMNRAPVWHQSLPSDRDTGRNYQLRVRENSPPGSPITTRNELFVYDLDSGENAEFNISLEDPFNLFDVEPKRVSGFASITLKLANRRGVRLLDYENINERSYIIQLHAFETRTSEQFRSKAQIQITVLDVNDNPPEFREPAGYVANIREDAPAGKMVKLIQASDRDEISRQALTYSLHGQTAHLFHINPHTGLVTVAKCEQPQTITSPRPTRFSSAASTMVSPKPCIDYETQRLHHLMVEANDGELSSEVPLTIWIEDASDNGPVFKLSIVDVVIEEGSERLDPPIKIEADDLDQTSTLSYSIVEGNFENLFSINNATGELQLTRPIRIAHDDLSSSASGTTATLTSGVSGSSSVDLRQQQLNKMTLIVQASDGEHTANGTIRIDILDANDNAPKFSRQAYEKEIPDSLTAGQSVMTVKAFDMDRGNNARVSYRIERGSYGQFEINELTGEISVASQARPFEVLARDNYTLEVVAYDHGLISKSSSVLVLIKVLGTIKRAPKFEPQIQRETINENTLNNTIIHRMLINEPQSQPSVMNNANPLVIMFEPGPIEGLDKHGQPVVEVERLESMFSVSAHTGDVVVNSGLSHDFASFVNLTVFVSYRPLTSAGPFGAPLETNHNSSNGVDELAWPKSVGYLVMNVVDDNDNAPIFAAPWTPSQPELSFQMLEELPVGSILVQLVASDADSKISHYEIEPANEYFELSSPQSGIIVNRRLIDYDTLMRQTFLSPGGHKQQASGGVATTQFGNNIIQFNVVVYDSGLRQLSSKAIVSVEILPINDNDCKFEQQLYEVRVRENPLPDTVVAQVRATDLDFGEQHNSIAYQLLGDQRDYFHIDARTGVVTISARGSLGLDREQLAQPFILLTVVGRDDGGQQTTSANQLVESQSSFQTQRSIRRQQPAGVSGRSCSATIKIHVDDVNDNPPLFSQKVYETTAYDTDTSDVPLLKLLVHDEDNARHNSSGSVGKNSFRILSGNLNDSFNITQNGMMYVTKPLNHSMTSGDKQTIGLRVQVRQQALPATGAGSGGALSTGGVPALFTDECLVRVHLVRINRYAPEWRQESLRDVTIEENAKPGTMLTQLRCFDRDLSDPKSANLPTHHQFADVVQEGAAVLSPKTASPMGKLNSVQQQQQQQQSFVSPIRYWIKENGTNVLETSEFRLDPVSGQLISRVELDRERRDFYQLIVSCEDNGRPQSLESITPLHISVLDQDDNRPEFILPKRQASGQVDSVAQAERETAKQPSVTFLVEEHQSKGLQVGELRALDRDLESRNPILYCLVEGNEFGEFQLDPMTGVLYTNQTLDREKQAHYDLLARAINDGSTCEDHTVASQTSTTVASQAAKQEASSGRIKIRVLVQDINDNAPSFKRPTFRAGVHHRALMNTLVTQVAGQDPDFELNGALNYRISEILLYKTHTNQQQSGGRHRTSDELSKPIKLIQSPFRIDQSGNIYTQQLLTQYQLMSMFVLSIEASEQAEPWRVASTKLEVYVYETTSQLKIRINLHPRLVESYRFEIEQMLSNATKYKAIINRARSYYGNVAADAANSPRGSAQPAGVKKPLATLNLDTGSGSNSVGLDPSEPNFSNIHAIFVDNHRLVNPHLVIERFDLTSAQLFTPQSLSQHLSGAGQHQDLLSRYNIGADGQASEVTSLIDKIALASTHSTAEHQHYSLASASPFTSSYLVGIDWLENPAVLYVALTSLLLLIGLLMCIIGCCCTSRIKDHIIKVAMDKLVKQQTLQAKINERVLAATNQAYANSALQRGGTTGSPNGQDYLQNGGDGGLMSSFDATKGCVNNNYENMSILQRAMETGEYIDPNYTTLNHHHHHLNLGAHYYDASELEQQEQMTVANYAAGDSSDGQRVGKQVVSGSVISLSLDDNEDEEERGHVDGELEFEHDLMDAGDDALKKNRHSNGHTNDILHGSLVSGHQHSRQRQQVPMTSHHRQQQQPQQLQQQYNHSDSQQLHM